MAVKMHEWNAPFLLKYGKPEHSEQAMNHPDHEVRKAVVRETDDLSHLTKLAHDPHEEVRRQVALRGGKHPQLSDVLMHDPHERVRETVAMAGEDHHLDHLMHDSHPAVRKKVAEWGKTKHHSHLANDPEPDVRAHVAAHTKDHDVIARMADDPHESVVKAAIRAASREDYTHLNDKIARRVNNDPSYVHHGKHWIGDYARNFT